MVADGQYALECEQRGVFLFLHICFWRDNQLCRVLVERTGRVVGQTQAEVNLLASLLSANSTRASLVCCNGCSFDLKQLLDNCPLFQEGVQSVKRFEDISLPKLKHKKSYCVFGCLEFFCVIRYILVGLGGSLDLECLL